MSRLVIYYNSAHAPLSSIAETPLTHVILAFLMPSAADPTKVEPSGNLDSVWPDVQGLQAAGKKVMISFGGGTATHEAYRQLAADVPGLARQIAGFVAQRGLDGVDIDFEDTAGFERGSAYDGVAFLVSLTRELAAALPAGKNLISHAPQPPYLSPYFEGGPYLKVLKGAGDDISWINLQYYNNPGFQDPGQITGLTGASPFVSSVTGLAQGVGGVAWPVAKTVIGKPVAPIDAHTGYLPVADLVSQVVAPLVGKYGKQVGGAMGWQYAQDVSEQGAWHNALAAALGLA